MNHPLSVAIVGGGIAGVGLALGLKEAPQLKVTLFESAPAFGEIGAGVSFGPNAVAALSGLGMGEPYRQLADRTPEPWQDIWFEWRRSGDASLLGTTLAPGVGQSSVHRADFLDALASRLPAGLAQFDKRAQHARNLPDGVQLSFADGSEHRCDVLIAADGIKSNLRGALLAEIGAEDPGPRFTGTRAYRGLIDSEQLRQRFRRQHLDERLIDVPQMYLAQDGHVLTFPVKHGRLINLVAFLTERPSPGWPPGEPWVREVSQRELKGAFADWGEAVRALLAAIERPTLWALHDLPELPCYAKGRIALIGDAAHAMLPHQGAGAGQGLEDAWFLRELLADPRLTQTQLPAVLETYDALRRPHASRVQRTSWEAGELYELRDPAIGADADRLAASLAGRFDWLWQHDLQSDVAKARKLLGWV